MQIGAIIKSGLKDWQILQQKHGYATIYICGIWSSEEEVKDLRVFARIVKEDTGETVIPWSLSEDLGDNKWEIMISNIPAGGLYRLETCVNNKNSVSFEWALRGDIIHHIGVGDLYVIAGQSNAAGYGKDPVYDPPELGIHLYKNSKHWDLASHPMNDSTNTLHIINRDGCNTGNSPYLSFSKYLKRELNYPIGLIQTSLGASPLSRWNPEEIGDLYQNMMDTILEVGGEIKGILWYQGCSDTDEEQSKTYMERFETMVKHVRKDVRNEELPVITVQISRVTSAEYEKGNQGWSKVREAQRQAANKIKNVFVIPSLDTTLSDLIHISSASCLVLGERMARLALQHIYSKNIKASAPDIKKVVQMNAKQVKMMFSNVQDRLYYYDATVSNISFGVEDDNGVVNIISYESMDPNMVILNLDRDIMGHGYVNNAFGMNPKCIIPVDFATHLPILAFHRVPIMIT